MPNRKAFTTCCRVIVARTAQGNGAPTPRNAPQHTTGLRPPGKALNTCCRVTSCTLRLRESVCNQHTTGLRPPAHHRVTHQALPAVFRRLHAHGLEELVRLRLGLCGRAGIVLQGSASQPISAHVSLRQHTPSRRELASARVGSRQSTAHTGSHQLASANGQHEWFAVSTQSESATSSNGMPRGYTARPTLTGPSRMAFSARRALRSTSQSRSVSRAW